MDWVKSLRERTWLLEALAALAFFAAFVALHRYVGMRQIAGFDFGPMVHLAAQLSAGRHANVDFISPYPPVFGWGLEFAFKWMGASWRSLVDLGGAFGALGAIAFFFVWRKLIPSWLAGVLAVVAAIQSVLFLGFWWYGPTVLWFSLLLVGLLAQKGAFTPARAAAIAIFAALLLLSKPNTAAPILLLGFLHLALPVRFAGRGKPLLALGAMASSVVLALLACWALDFNVWAYARLLAQLSSRVGTPVALAQGLPWALDYQISGSIAFILAILGFLFFGSIRAVAQNASANGAWLCAALLLSFLASFFLNGEYPLASCPLIAAACALSAGRALNGKQVAAIAVCWALAGIHAGVKAIDRDRVLSCGEGQFFEFGANVVQQDGFFKGVTTGPRFADFTSETGNALRVLAPKTVFFGPRVEFGYAQFGYAPPRGLPLWWDPKSAYPMTHDSAVAVVRAWKAARFDLLVLDRDDATFLQPEIMQAIESDYLSVGPNFANHESSVYARRDWLAARAARRAAQRAQPAR